MVQLSFAAFVLLRACAHRKKLRSRRPREILSNLKSLCSSLLYRASLQAKSEKDATKESEVYKKLFTKDYRANISSFVIASRRTDKLRDKAV